MSHIESFVVDVDTDQPLICVRLIFGTKSPKLLQEAIDKLVQARDRLKTVYTLQDEEDD